MDAKFYSDLKNVFYLIDGTCDISFPVVSYHIFGFFGFNTTETCDVTTLHTSFVQVHSTTAEVAGPWFPCSGHTDLG